MTTAVSELVGSAPAVTPFDILRAAFVELRVKDLREAEHFYVDLLGMIVAARTNDAVYLRAWEERQHHSLILRRDGSPAVSRLGFRVRSDSDLEQIADHLGQSARGLSWQEPGQDPGLGRTLRVWDRFGHPLEFFHSIDAVAPSHQRFDQQRGAPLLRFDHVNLHAPRPEEVIRSLLDLGFACTEYISTDGPNEQVTGAWLRRKPTVHDVALTAGVGPRLHHFAYWVGEPAGILHACDMLAAGEYSSVIERGPGRHGVSNAFFVYLRDPDGHRIELYSCDYYTGDPDHRPLRWSVNDPRCRSFWGAKAPDSWYDESSDLLGPDGSVLATTSSSVDERAQRSEVLA